MWSSLAGEYTSTSHHAPSVQYVHLAYFRQFLYFVLVSSSLYEELDVSKIWHVFSTLGEEELTELMMPTAKGEIPPYTIIHQGACEKRDLEL